jgi:hypothetical protein
VVGAAARPAALTALLQGEGETVTRLGRIAEGQGVVYQGKLL